MKQIVESLTSLKLKGYINFDCSDVIEYHTPLLITLTRDPKDNYTQLYRWMFEAASNPKEFFVLCYIAKWINFPTYNISLLEWADVLGYSGDKSVRRLLDSMEKDKKITVSHGVFIAVDRRSMNGYALNKEVLVEEAKFNTEQITDNPVNEIDDNREVLTADGYIAVKRIELKIEHSHWGKKDNEGRSRRLDQGDYDLYRMCKDNDLYPKKVKHWANIMEKMKKSDTYDAEFETYDKNYSIRINKLKLEMMLKTSKNAIIIKGETIVVDAENIHDYYIELDTEFYFDPNMSGRVIHKVKELCHTLNLKVIPVEIEKECIAIFKEHVISGELMTVTSARKLVDKLNVKFGSGEKIIYEEVEEEEEDHHEQHYNYVVDRGHEEQVKNYQKNHEKDINLDSLYD